MNDAEKRGEAALEALRARIPKPPPSPGGAGAWWKWVGVLLFVCATFVALLRMVPR